MGAPGRRGRLRRQGLVPWEGAGEANPVPGRRLAARPGTFCSPSEAVRTTRKTLSGGATGPGDGGSPQGKGAAGAGTLFNATHHVSRLWRAGMERSTALELVPARKSARGPGRQHEPGVWGPGPEAGPRPGASARLKDVGPRPGSPGRGPFGLSTRAIQTGRPAGASLGSGVEEGGSQPPADLPSVPSGRPGCLPRRRE
jgi:hypothetical protein